MDTSASIARRRTRFLHGSTRRWVWMSSELRGGPGANRANAFASFLLGLPQQMGRTLQVPEEFTLRSSFYSAYIRDKWDMTRNLSFNFGVRWEYLPFPT